MRLSFRVALSGPQVKSGQPAQIIVVGVETVRRLATRPLDLGLLELRRDGPDDTRGDLVLQVEDILERSVEPVCPQMRAGCGIDELPRNADAAPCLSDAA